jgi:peroxiredoxin
MATTRAEPKIKPRDMIPIFQLMSVEGQPVNIWTYKGRKNIVIVFLTKDLSPPYLEFLRSITNLYPRYEEEDAVVLVIVKGSLNDAITFYHNLKPPFPILYDDGRVTSQFTNQLPAVFVADRFGEVRGVWITDPEQNFPTHKEILDTLDLINLECPECGAPVEWE